MTKRAARGWLIGLGGVIAALVIAVVWARIGFAPPPSRDGAVVGRVYTQQDEQSFLSGLVPDVVREGVVFAVPSEELSSFWSANGRAGDPPSVVELRTTVVVVDRESIFEAQGALDDLGDGSFELKVHPGPHLICYSDTPPGDRLATEGCDFETLDVPGRLRVLWGQSFAILKA